VQYVKQRRAAGKVDNTIIYHHQKARIRDGMNIAVEWRCTTYASHPFSFCLANKPTVGVDKNTIIFVGKHFQKQQEDSVMMSASTQGT
jgi:hypothetical protein